MAILKRGLRGEPVRRLQARLEIEADGIFGKGTAKAVREYQRENGLAADGIAGPDTFAHMGLYELVLLKRGTRGPTVKRLQKALGIGADGIFGKGTEASVRTFQADNGLRVDGKAGPATLAQMELFTEVTAETVAKAEVPADYVEPEVPAGIARDDEAVAAAKELETAAAEQEEKDSGIWGTVKGWFS